MKLGEGLRYLLRSSTSAFNSRWEIAKPRYSVRPTGGGPLWHSGLPGENESLGPRRPRVGRPLSSKETGGRAAFGSADATDSTADFVGGEASESRIGPDRASRAVCIEGRSSVAGLSESLCPLR